jgi:hypothetical protein
VLRCVFDLGCKRVQVVEKAFAHLAAVAGVQRGENMVDVLDVLASCTPVRVGAVATRHVRPPLNAGVSGDNELDCVVYIALLLWRIANQSPTLVADEDREHFSAPRAVDVVSYVCFQCLLGNLIAPFKEELRVFASNEW